MTRIILVLMGLAVVLLMLRSYTAQDRNRRSIERGVAAGQGQTSRPAVPLRPPTTDGRTRD